MNVQPFDTESLIHWFEEEKRDLPWRNSPSPYAVWVSEVMLQQTQVSVVIPYFEKWMRRFPTVQDLAAASVDEVIKLWEGLGYYSRARNLLLGARTVCEKFGGELPKDAEKLAAIKGLGPYTIGAIRSFAFHEKAEAVDGNVLRVIARYFQIADDIAKPATMKNIRTIVQNLLPDDKHWVVNEALIELGAKVCRKDPNCKECPLRQSCQSFRNAKTGVIPFKSTKIASIPLYRDVAVILHDDAFLVRRGKSGEIMHDLHEFPYFDTPREGICLSLLGQRIEEMLGLQADFISSLPKISQSFTKYRVQLKPHLYCAKSKREVENYFWLAREKLAAIAFSSGHRKIAEKIQGLSH